MTKLDTILYEFLVENGIMAAGEFRLLSEEVKTETVLQVAHDVLNTVQAKIKDVDTVSINKSRGEIKNFSDLKTVQDSVTRLTNMAYSYAENIPPELPKYLKEITKSIYNLNKYAPQFKEAYRSKKTLVILRYQSVILSIISSLSYIISVVIDFKNPNAIGFKPNMRIEEILPIRSVIDFNTSIENGSFDAALRDTATLREFFVEYSVEEMSTIYEAVDIVNLINNGIDSFSNFFNNGNRNGVIFKVLGIIMIILSLRDVFYTLYNSRTKIAEKMQQLRTFLNVDKLPSTNAVTKFITFNNKNASEMELSSKEAEREISTENKEIISNVKNRPSEFDATADTFIPAKTDEKAPAIKTSDIFADFNF